MFDENKRYIGYKLTEDIHTPSHGLLLKKDSILTLKQVERLTAFNISISSYTQFLQGPRQFFSDMMNEQIFIFKNEFNYLDENSDSVKKLEEEMVPTLIMITEQIDIQTLMLNMKSHDDYTFRHNIAVAMLAAKLAGWLGYSKEKVNRIAYCGLLHDIGKTRIPTNILNKENRLTDHEFAVMQHHTTFGYKILQAQEVGEDVSRAALEHHEREDGSGYPHKKKSDYIHPYAKIIAIVDCFHAMTSDRPYRKALSFYEALIQLQADTFGKLDPKKTLTFIFHIMQSSIGSQVVLSDGRVGMVKFIPLHNPIFPYIDVDGEILNTATSPLYIETFKDDRVADSDVLEVYKGVNNEKVN
ncbi:HD-GYP domain-containing protein [Alkalihalophilus pseudofirmus]|uniref:HD-GYP domain-containing protein n=1 Tax=Alkalihalophilus pseudofirmus TaxID=79885 RepID=UPI00259BB4E3|nr:HD-GYP domain-containing protein [Alkalihalophilus pseudofirmus]WEG16562.1 HD-GYP domain-containing protein [Alkalihalophilus pseudofirmus]